MQESLSETVMEAFVEPAGRAIFDRVSPQDGGVASIKLSWQAREVGFRGEGHRRRERREEKHPAAHAASYGKRFKKVGGSARERGDAWGIRSRSSRSEPRESDAATKGSFWLARDSSPDGVGEVLQHRERVEGDSGELAAFVDGGERFGGVTIAGRARGQVAVAFFAANVVLPVPFER